MQHLQVNSTLHGGKYRIEQVLGQGGFGNTYYGYNTVFNEPVAIKEFFMQGINDRDASNGLVCVSIKGNKPQFEEQREKFKKEALRIRKLNNPHIIKVHDLFEENGTAYYVMDYVDGENLAERLKRTGKPMTEQDVREILPQILDALKSVHDAGIWHLDLKPANILVDKSNNVKLIDFGASKQLNVQKGGATTSTAISYTNGYAPREQMEQNYDKFGPWTDIYALGATLYTLLTNKRPPLPTDIDDDISEDKHIALPFPYYISEDIRKLVLSMMHTNRIQRPQNVESIVSFLRDFSLSVKDKKEISNEETIIASDNASEVTPIETLRKRAENGDASAQNDLGYYYLSGEIVEQDKALAYFWFKKAAEGGNADGQNRIGVCYARGFGVEENKQKAVEWYKKAAEQGHVKAQCNLGHCYAVGKGIVEDIQMAYEWWKKAAEQGFDQAQLLLAQCYDNGKGVRRNKEKAFEWYMKAAKQGNADAQFNVAWCYMNGVGIEENKEEAFRWYNESAERGNISAQNNLAYCYDNGDGVEKNKEKAFKWFKKAAELGNVVAQNNLGNCYDNGNGIEEDKEKAFEWYKKSAEQGNADAQYNLAACYDNGKGIKEDKKKAFEWYKASAEQENAGAQYKLALCYDNGIGIKEDKQVALEWYKKAANNGNTDSIKVVKPLLKKALSERNFYVWRIITFFASWFSAYFFLFLGILAIGAVIVFIEKISHIIGIDIGFSLDGHPISLWIIIPIFSLSFFSILSTFFLLPFSSNKQSHAFSEACKDSGISISIYEIDNYPYFITCW